MKELEFNWTDILFTQPNRKGVYCGLNSFIQNWSICTLHLASLVFILLVFISFVIILSLLITPIITTLLLMVTFLFCIALIMDIAASLPILLVFGLPVIFALLLFIPFLI